MEAESVDPTVAPPAPTLERVVAALAGRLARLLEQLPAGRGGPFASSVAFLNAREQRGAEAHEPTQRIAPLDRLVDRLGLGPLDLELALLAALPDEHELFADVLRVLHPRGEPRPTAALAAMLLARDPDERHLVNTALHAGPATRSGLVSLDGDGPLPERSLSLAEAIWPTLQGIDAWPAGLAPLARAPVTLGLERWLEGPDAAAAVAMLQRGAPATLLVTADDTEVAFERAAAVAAHARVPYLRWRWPADGAPQVERLLRLHALARGVVPIVALPEPDGPRAPTGPGFEYFPSPSVICGGTGASAPRGGRPLLVLTAGPLRATDRRRMWRGALPQLADSAELLAARYPVEPALAAEVAADLSVSAAGRAPTVDDVATSVRSRTAAAVTPAVTLRRAAAGWDRLVLRPERMEVLREAVDRLVMQGRVLDEWRFLDGRAGARGVRLLFAGPPGTGKTLSAEVLANALGVDLLVVDISRVVSKWIGETEKNLAQVFAAAERSTAVLLFDEADALFGKRTEVSDAHDRYANLETAYLLARLERFEGMAILSTNLRENIDRAFLRRLEFVVDFDEPELAEREALWRCHMPSGPPLAPDVDYTRLARLYPVVGGLIRNAAAAAAFLAAAEQQPIAQRHLVHAMRREYEKIRRAFPGSPVGTPRT